MVDIIQNEPWDFNLYKKENLYKKIKRIFKKNLHSSADRIIFQNGGCKVFTI